jgi:hypothetical protein
MNLCIFHCICNSLLLSTTVQIIAADKKQELVSLEFIHFLGFTMTMIFPASNCSSISRSIYLAIARAVYKDATISLLDDCLSAVDAHVGRDLFEKCIIDVLLNKQDKAKKKKRTVVLATNALQYLSHSMVDRIIVMRDGMIVESGSYKELSLRDDSHFNFFLDSFNESMNKDNASTNDEDIEEGEENVYEEATEDVLVDIDYPSEVIEERRRSSVLSTTFSRRSSISIKKLRSSLDGEKVEKKKNAKLMTDELAERGVGKIGWEVYSVWLEAAGGLWVLLPLFTVFAAPMVIDYKSKFWLTESWGPDLYGKDQIYYLEIYALLQLAGIILAFIQYFPCLIFGLIAGRKVSFTCACRIVNNSRLTLHPTCDSLEILCLLSLIQLSSPSSSPVYWTLY